MSNFQIIGRVSHPEPIQDIPGAEKIALTHVGGRPTVVSKGMIKPESSDSPPVYIFFPEDSILPFATDVDLGKLTGDALVPQAAREVGLLTDFLTKVGKNGNAKKPIISIRRYLGQFSMGLYLAVDAEKYPALNRHIRRRYAEARANDVRDPNELVHLVDEVSVTLNPEAVGVQRKADEVEDQCSGGGSASAGNALPKDGCPMFGPSAYDLENARNKGFFSNVEELAKAMKAAGISAALEVTEKIEGMNARIAVRYAGDTPGNDRARFEVVYGTRNRWVRKTHTQRDIDGNLVEVPTPFAQAIDTAFAKTSDQGTDLLIDNVLAVLADMHGGTVPTYLPGQAVCVLFGEVYGHFWRGKGENKVAFRYDLPQGVPLGFRAFDLWVADEPAVGKGHWWDLHALNESMRLPIVPKLTRIILTDSPPFTLEEAVRHAEGASALYRVNVTGRAENPHIREGAVYRVVYDMGAQAWREPGKAHLVRQPTMVGRHGEFNLVAKIPGEGYLALKYGA